MFKNKIFIFFIKYVPLCVAIIVTSYLVVVINEVSLKVKEREILGAAPQNIESILEEGTIVKSEQLRSYFDFSNLNYNQWKNENIEGLEIKRDKLFIQKELKLPNLYENHCRRYSCYQNKIDFEKFVMRKVN